MRNRRHNTPLYNRSALHRDKHIDNTIYGTLCNGGMSTTLLWSGDAGYNIHAVETTPAHMAHSGGHHNSSLVWHTHKSIRRKRAALCKRVFRSPPVALVHGAIKYTREKVSVTSCKHSVEGPPSSPEPADLTCAKKTRKATPSEVEPRKRDQLSPTTKGSFLMLPGLGLLQQPLCHARKAEQSNGDRKRRAQGQGGAKGGAIRQSARHELQHRRGAELLALKGEDVYRVTNSSCSSPPSIFLFL